MKKDAVVDFETYYSQEYSLTRMSTEDYVCDPRFEVILVAVKLEDAPVEWFSGTMAQTKAWLKSLRLEGYNVIGHNNLFDGLILAHHFGIVPARYGDTLSMAQAMLKPFLKSISLDSCLKHIDLGIRKGDEVRNMLGRTRLSLSNSELEGYAAYCCNDVEGTSRLYNYLRPQFPEEEMIIIDLVLRMYLQPRFELDVTLLCELLAETKAKQAVALAQLPADLARSDMMSNQKFADILRSYGIEPPTKISPTTGETTYAFSKSDMAWKELEEEWADDPEISALLAARISAKSTIEESRLERLIHIAKQHPKFRIPLRYYAAHTGRLGGMEKINAQNFPRIDKSRMRFAIRAPKGHKVIAADLAQIEARVTAWLAKCEPLVTAFRDKQDVYSLFATRAYKIDTKKNRSKQDDRRRFVGKTCILGLGFGVGAATLRTTLRRDGVKVGIPEAQQFVNIYRSDYSEIPQLWRYFDAHISFVASGAGVVQRHPISITPRAIVLPNGMPIAYNALRHVRTTKYEGWAYSYAGTMKTLWGGKITENVVQALARIIVMGHMVNIYKATGIAPALQQHDELDYVVPESVAVKFAKVVEKFMSTPPSWAPDLPVAVEVNIGDTLGDCK